MRDAHRNRGPFAWLALIDLADDGNTCDETMQIAQAFEAARLTMFNTCFG